MPKGWLKRAIWRDPAYTLVMSNPEMLAALAKLFKGEPWARNIDPKKLKVLSARHVGAQLEQRYDDLLLSVGYKRSANGRAPRKVAFLLIEFQSTVDPFMALRLSGQMNLVYRDLTLNRRTLGGNRLAAMVPIVIYTGKRRWTACRALSEMIEEGVTRCQFETSYELVEVWREGTRPDEDNMFLLLCQLERGMTPTALLETTKILRRRVTEAGSKRLEETCALWLRGLFGERVPNENWEDYETMEQIEGALEGISKDWTDQWQANARKEGRREGRRAGRREGRREGLVAGQRERRQEERSLMNASVRAKLQEEVRDRFGRAVAAAFAAAITTVENHEKLVDLAVRVGTCKHGDELLESVRNV